MTQPQRKRAPGRRTKGDGGLSKSKAKGLWRGSVEIPTTDGKRRRQEVSSRDRNKALAKLKALRAQVDNGYIPVTGSTTVEKWLTRWIEEIHGPTLRPKTKRGYADTIRLDIVPQIGGVKLAKLTPQQVRTAYAAIAEKSDRSAQQAHIVLRCALGAAIKEGILQRNITDAVARPRYVATEQQPLTAEQAQALLRASRKGGDPNYPRWLTRLLTAMRPGEVLGMQWSRTDLKKAVADVSWQLQQLQQAHGCGEKTGDGWPCGRQRPGWCPERHWDLPTDFKHEVLHRSLLLTRPKTTAGQRGIPLIAPLVTALERHRDATSGQPNPHGLIFHTPMGHPVSPRDDADLWKDALKKAGLPPAPPYVTRHTTNTLLLEALVPEEIRMRILGQKSVKAHKSYVHVSDELAREALTNLDDLSN